MSLFQNTVVTKYLKAQNKEEISIKWNLFKNHFKNSTIQENIRNSKEEQYQGGFIIDLFVNVLGYTKNPTPNFTITTEYKNVKDSKKADGAIVINDEVKAVIELKGTNTTDLGKIEVQAFGYKNNQPKCTYVITSNFEKLRFYIDNAIEHIEFNLFTLTEKDFELLYLCLGYENLSKDIANKIKKDSLSEEDVITKSLYKDYSLFKRELHQNLIQLNPQYDSLTLFKESQTLLDRFLFLFFAEDRQLLPPNSVRLILTQWKKLQELDAYTPLFDRFKKYFGYLNTGFKGKQYDVYAYNGGLFKPNAIIDSVKIDDDLLYKYTLKLSDYDFDSEVDVNILGHIFENSLNELDEIKAELEGQVVDKSKTKRKKDGVFYTPKYITKYIVENTVGKLCDEQKIALEINEDDYITDKKRQKKTIKGLIDKLTTYRNWLLQLTICDPACGSGAFLNQTLDFLINEHSYIDELQAKLFGDAMVLNDVEKSILENNLFGVDLNDESVEIAKLSLWLRTAQPNRKLNDLNNNIKCGNSLIDDPEIAGDKAFNWQQEFPQIFTKGGFDVVIGNPPYTYRNAISEEEKNYFKQNYKCIEGNFDLYKLFMEKSTILTKTNGFSSFIVPNTFLSAKTYKKLRVILINECKIIEFFDLGLNIFENVVVESTIFTFQKNKVIKQKEVKVKIQRDRERSFDNLEYEYFIDIDKYSGKDSTFNINISDEYSSIIDKMKHNSLELGEICYCTVGINTGYIKSELTSSYKIDDRYHKMLNGKDIGRNKVLWAGEYIMYDIDFIKSRGDKGRALPPEYIFTQDKILVQRTRRGMKRKLIGYLDKEKYFNLNRLSNLVLIDNQYSLDIIYPMINSKLLDFYFNIYFNEYEVKPLHLAQLPINKSSKGNHSLERFTKSILSLNTELQEVSSKFQRTLQRKFELEKLPKKLENWYLLGFGDFVKELKKKKITLSLSEEAEWEDYFLQEQQKALELKTKIDATDKEIDTMVYELYGLTQEEIEIVENS
jgi:type I restriction-modification system DNA methylase subunit